VENSGESEKKEKPTIRQEAKPKYNFEISIQSHNLNNFQIYLLMIPDRVFNRKRFNNIFDFEKSGRYYKRVKRYLYKIKRGKLYKNIQPGKYHLAFLYFDGYFFYREKIFRTLKLKKYFHKHYNISDKNFKLW